ncbi:hypothetical protein GCM10023338_13770 [Wohlfahrtiimonas larvae]|uniref:Type II secretion system protein H n=2 Tax=Wohlfahrtiimonas larvae TaxID=1157986 RepID=A0ABP9MW70_9GAMM
MTLIELMIVLSIISISALLAIPSFSELFHQYYYKNAALILNKDIRFAKTTANQRKMRVSMCISIDHITCLDEPSMQWHQGWIVFLDPNNNFTPTPNNILRQRPSQHPSVYIYSSYNIQNGVQFNIGKKAGRSLGTGLANGYFMICGQNRNAQKLIINVYGRLRKEELMHCEN